MSVLKLDDLGDLLLTDGVSHLLLEDSVVEPTESSMAVLRLEEGLGDFLLTDGVSRLLLSIDGDLVVCYANVYNALEELVPDQTFTFELVNVNVSTNVWGKKIIQSATSDENGYLEITLMSHTRWKMTGPDGHWVYFETSGQPYFQLPYFRDSSF